MPRGKTLDWTEDPIARNARQSRVDALQDAISPESFGYTGDGGIDARAPGEATMLEHVNGKCVAGVARPPRKKPLRMTRERRDRIEVAVDALIRVLDELENPIWSRRLAGRTWKPATAELAIPLSLTANRSTTAASPT